MLIILEVKYLEFDFRFCLSSHEQEEPLKFTGKEDLPGERGSSPVELLDEFGQDIRLLSSGYVSHIEVLAADQLAVPQEESLHNSV